MTKEEYQNSTKFVRIRANAIIALILVIGFILWMEIFENMNLGYWFNAVYFLLLLAICMLVKYMELHRPQIILLKLLNDNQADSLLDITQNIIQTVFFNRVSKLSHSQKQGYVFDNKDCLNQARYLLGLYSIDENKLPLWLKCYLKRDDNHFKNVKDALRDYINHYDSTIDIYYVIYNKDMDCYRWHNLESAAMSKQLVKQNKSLYNDVTGKNMLLLHFERSDLNVYDWRILDTHVEKEGFNTKVSYDLALIVKRKNHRQVSVIKTRYDILVNVWGISRNTNYNVLGGQIYADQADTKMSNWYTTSFTKLYRDSNRIAKQNQLLAEKTIKEKN